MENSLYRVGQCREGEWLCYRWMDERCFRPLLCTVKAELVSLMPQRMENGHVTEVDNFIKGEWSCYIGGQFNGGSMVMLQRWSV